VRILSSLSKIRIKENNMSTNKTAKLERFLEKEVRVNYNVAKDIDKPSVLFTGILHAYKVQYYEINITGGTWLVFTDDNILNIWDEANPYIEIG
jgi:hypothetical protein